MRDRRDYIEGLDSLAALYAENPALPLGDGIDINLHRYGSHAIEAAEQVRLAVAVVKLMREPELRLKLNRGAPTAWLFLNGYLGELRVSLQMWADEVCERRPTERLKRDRWVFPPELVAAIEQGATSG